MKGFLRHSHGVTAVHSVWEERAAGIRLVHDDVGLETSGPGPGGLRQGVGGGETASADQVALEKMCLPRLS